MNDDSFLKKGTFLAVRSPEDSFYLCRLDEDIADLHATSHIKIMWLEKSKNNNEYILSKRDKILGATVICEIFLTKLSRFKYKLPNKGLRFIKQEIAYILEQECSEISYKNGNTEIMETNESLLLESISDSSEIQERKTSVTTDRYVNLEDSELIDGKTNNNQWRKDNVTPSKNEEQFLLKEYNNIETNNSNFNHHNIEKERKDSTDSNCKSQGREPSQNFQDDSNTSRSELINENTSDKKCEYNAMMQIYVDNHSSNDITKMNDIDNNNIKIHRDDPINSRENKLCLISDEVESLGFKKEVGIKIENDKVNPSTSKTLRRRKRHHSVNNDVFMKETYVSYKEMSSDTENEEPFQDSGSDFIPSDEDSPKSRSKNCVFNSSASNKTQKFLFGTNKGKYTTKNVIKSSKSTISRHHVETKKSEIDPETIENKLNKEKDVEEQNPKVKPLVKVLQNVVINSSCSNKSSKRTNLNNDIAIGKIYTSEVSYGEESEQSFEDNFGPNDNEYFLNNMEPNECISETKTDQEETENQNIKITKSRKSSGNKFYGKKSVSELSNKKIGFDIAKKYGESGKRIYDKMHSCYLCQSTCIKMARHLEYKHHNELAVAKLLALEKKSTERKKGFLELTRIGDFYHNMEVLSLKTGQLILCRRPSENLKTLLTYDRFGPCPYCLGFMLKSYLFIHVKKCISKNVRDDEGIKKSIQLASNAIVNSILFDGNVHFKENILDRLKNDAISSLCKCDSLILGFGCMLFEKHGTTQNDLIRQSMRQLGRLLDNIHQNNPQFMNRNLTFFFKPEYFDLVINSVKSLCLAKSGSLEKDSYGVPSLALKIGHSMRKCIGFLRGQALRAGCVEDDFKLKSFLDLLELEWEIRVSSNALNTLNTRKMNNVELLPVTDDLLKLNKFISNEIDIFKVLLQNNPCEKDAWFRLAEAALARTILFNKRRGGEVSRMTLKQYLSSPDWSKESTQELQNTLTNMEKGLANKLKLIQIRGKRGRTVPVILTEEVVSAINLLISTRSLVGVPSDNKYIFSKVHNNSLSYIRGSDVIRTLAIKANLKNPSSVTSTKLRKYVATVSQVFNLKETETDWLARHLGHDIRVHRDFYRLHESAVELTKISRLLLAVDEGKVARFKGRTLEEINLNDLPDLSEDEAISDDEIEINEEQQHSEEQSVSIECINQPNNPESVPKPQGRKRPVPWTTEESEAVLKFFRVQVKKKIVPGKDLCESCINDNQTVLARRTWKDIKYYVKNYITKIKKFKI